MATISPFDPLVWWKLTRYSVLLQAQARRITKRIIGLSNAVSGQIVKASHRWNGYKTLPTMPRSHLIVGEGRQSVAINRFTGVSRRETYAEACRSNDNRPTCVSCYSPCAYDREFRDARLCGACYGEEELVIMKGCMIKEKESKHETV